MAKSEKLPGSGVKVGKKGAKRSESDNLGKKAKGGGGFKNPAMEHKR